MIIYHKTNGKNVTTEVILSAGQSKVSNSTHIWDKHKNAVNTLKNNEDVYVTGGTYINSIYSGKFEPRKMFEHYITAQTKTKRT